MRKLISRLRSRAGESLIETLAAILVFTMASIVLYTMITTAAEMNAVTKAQDRTIQTQLAEAEMGEGAAAAGTVTMTLEGASESFAEVDVEIYGGQNGALYAYYMETGGAG